MWNKIPCMILLVLLGCNTCFAQTSYRGLQPGKSTKAEVQNILGEPVTRVSETLIEYAPKRDGKLDPLEHEQKIYVQYRPDSPVVDRIEVLYSEPDFYGLWNAKGFPGLGSPSPFPDVKRRNPNGKLEEYYGAPRFIVLTYSEEQFVGREVIRVGYYSRELFEVAIAKVSPAQ